MFVVHSLTQLINFSHFLVLPFFGGEGEGERGDMIFMNVSYLIFSSTAIFVCFIVI